MLVFDCETNGLLDKVSKVHSLVIYDTETQETFSCINTKNSLAEGSYLSIEAGISILMGAEEVVGHNIIKYDIPVLEKLYPDFKIKGKVFDTLSTSKLIYPDIADLDYRMIAKRKYDIPKKLIGKYSLKAFGYRLGELKGDFNEQEDCWTEWSVSMQRYCEQDVVVTTKLYNNLKSKDASQEALDLEHKFAQIIFKQEQRGVSFDLEKARTLDSTLRQRKFDLEQKLKELFPPLVKKEIFIPKSNNKTRGYVKGVPFEKRTIVEFNPGSRQMVGERLIHKYGWKPKVKTETGLPKIDESVLKELTYEEAPVLAEYFLITKTLGQLSEGKNAWLRLEKNGVIHGQVDTGGAVTGRCTHNRPNLAQVPSCGSVFGKECRELFKAREGFQLVGVDASGLELRCLAHYMGDPDYTHEILSGDIHTKNQLAAGLPTRNDAKTFIYGLLN